MNFPERLKKVRLEKNLTQEELAEKTGLASKTISRYENGETIPRNKNIYFKLAEALSSSYEDLVTPEENFILNAKTNYGSIGKKDAENMINGVIGLMAGGQLPEEDKDAIFEALQEAYWESKISNKRYARRKK